MSDINIYPNNGTVADYEAYYNIRIDEIKKKLSSSNEECNEAEFTLLSAELVGIPKRKQSDIMKAKTREHIERKAIETCGAMPANYRDYITGFVQKHNITIRLDDSLVGSTYNGNVEIKNTAILRSVLYELKGKAHLDLAKSLGTDEDFRISFELYLEEHKQNRKKHLIEAVSYRHIDGYDKIIDGLVKMLFHYDGDTGQGFELVKRAFLKGIWQVKRKMRGLPVSYPIMPIIFGAEEGTGKSHFIELLFSPISENVIPSVSYENLADKSNVTLWGSWVCIVEELAGFGKAEQEKLRDVITRKSHPVRILHHNYSINVPNASTCWGTSNANISAIIKSSGNMRRFFQFNWKPTLGDANKDEMIEINRIRNVLNEINWTELLQSIDESGDDPLVGYEEELRASQVLLRTKTVIEEWIDALVDNDDQLVWLAPKGGRELYKDFKIWAQEYGSTWARQYTETRFGTELKITKCVIYNHHDRTYSLEGHTIEGKVKSTTRMVPDVKPNGGRVIKLFDQEEKIKQKTSLMNSSPFD